jgi:hypothetical protein
VSGGVAATGGFMAVAPMESMKGAAAIRTAMAAGMGAMRVNMVSCAFFYIAGQAPAGPTIARTVEKTLGRRCAATLMQDKKGVL